MNAPIPHSARPSLVATLVAASLVTAAAAPAAAGRKKQPVREPILTPAAASMTPPYTVKGPAIELTMNGAQIRVEPLDENRREAWFQLRTTLGGDPLPKRADYPEGFTVFEVSFANYSQGTLTFSPSVASCWRTKDHDLRPIHLDLVLELMRSFRGVDGFNQAPLVTEALRTFHLEPLLLRPGQRASRLLLYRGSPGDAEELRLDLVNLEVGEHVIHPRFLFEVHQPARR